MPVVTSVSQATRASRSSARIAPSTASVIWSGTVSGWPSVTDSDVKTCRLSVMEGGRNMMGTPSAAALEQTSPGGTPGQRTEGVDETQVDHRSHRLAQDRGHLDR